jgi:predicted metalloprotease with PDZ domain
MLRRRVLTACACALLLLGCRPPHLAPDEEGAAELREPSPVTPRRPRGGAVEHTVRFADRSMHYVEVESIFPTGGEEELVLFMPVWTPGSYLVREYARNVEALEAATVEGAALEVEKTRKNRWTVATGGARRVVVRYRVYAAELDVRSSFVDSDMAVLNGASIFLCPVGGLAREQDVLLETPDEWLDAATSLAPHAEGRHRFVARSYDALVDSPIVVGDAEVRAFDAGGASFELWTFGGEGVWDDDRAARDLAILAETEVALFAQAPFSRFLFLNVLGGEGGGLEHLDSTLCMSSRFAMRRASDYRRWLAMMSHELFHAWNGKRLRPRALGPFDYENEVYTESLWFVEGITSYYDELLLARAGLMTEEQYLERLTKTVTELRDTPGRRVQSLAESSYDAWIKFYRWDENSRNSSVSYYGKGALVGWLLDAEIRRATGGAKSLDDVMRLAYERWSGERGYTPEELRAVVDEVAGTSFDGFFARYVGGTEELDFEPAFRLFGLELESEETDGDGEGALGDDEEAGWMGVSVNESSGRFVVSEVVRDSPAFEAGINVDDELLAIEGFRIARDGVGAHLERHRPGEAVEVLLSRRDRMRTIRLTLGTRPAEDLRVAVDDGASATTRAARASWLGGSARATPAPAQEPERRDEQASGGEP